MRADIYEKLDEHFSCCLELTTIDEGIIGLTCMEHGIILLDLDANRQQIIVNDECPHCHRRMIKYCPECDGGASEQLILPYAF